MLKLALICLVSMAFGLYAGKKRAKGLGWHKILYDGIVDLCGLVASMWRTVSGPFRKGSGTTATGPDGKEIEVVDE